MRIIIKKYFKGCIVVLALFMMLSTNVLASINYNSIKKYNRDIYLTIDQAFYIATDFMVSYYLFE